jgi:hypothetical protein
MEPHELSADLEPVRAAWRKADWPGVEEGLSWGTPALKVRGKMLARMREPGVLVVLCDMEEKEMLIQADPEVYFQTDHYRGYPAILIRLDKIEPDDLLDRLEAAWRSQATKRMIAEYDTRSAG